MEPNKITEEQLREAEQAEKQMIANAHEYIYNVLDLGTQYNEDGYNKAFEEKKGPDKFTDFDVPTTLTNMTTLVHGYGSFGRPFLEAVYEKDKASLLNMFETVTQEYLELDAAVKTWTAQMETHLANQKAQEETISNAINEN